MEQSASSQAPDETGHESDVEVGVVGNGKDGVRYNIIVTTKLTNLYLRFGTLTSMTLQC